jgi:hypothetical protein
MSQALDLIYDTLDVFSGKSERKEKARLFDDELISLADNVYHQSMAHNNYSTIRLLENVVRRYVPDSADRDQALEILGGTNE